MRKQFDTRKTNPQKTDISRASGLLRRSRVQSISSEHEQKPQNLPGNVTHASQGSSFRQDFSNVPVQTATTPPIQPKLQVGRPGDRYEQEADQVAEQVMHSTSSATISDPVQQVPAIGRIQPEPDNNLRRQPSAEEDKKKVAKETAHKAEQKKQQAEKEKVAAEEKAVKADKDKYGKEKKKKEDDKVQTQAQPGQVPTVTPALENHLDTRQASGQPLPDTTRTFMESRFHHDFSKVRVHNDSQATQALNAQAFTRRHDIFFNPAQYQPEAPVGQRLLAHELTHVVQQGAAPAKPSHQPKTTISVSTGSIL
jgi:hypothetical protein